MSNTSNSKNSNKNDGSDDWIGELLVDIVTGIAHLLGWGLRFPLLGVPVVITCGVGIWQGLNIAMFTLAGFIAANMVWAVLDETTFEQYVINPPYHYFQRWSRYERSWSRVCAMHGLTAKHGDREHVPALRTIGIGHDVDVLDVTIVTGQSITHWHKQTEALAAAWRAQRVTITATTPGQIRVTVMRADVLAEPIALPLPTPTTPVELAAIGAGATESGDLWQVPVLGHHVLIAGASGAGKGSVLWSLIAGLAPDVRTGKVRLCVIDPKGGMELSAGAPMFTAFTHDATGTTVELLRTLVDVMNERAHRLRGRTRLHTPTVAEPLFAVVIDELAALTAYVTDRKIRIEIEHLLGLLLSQGRAVGISVIAAIQDPAKDTLPVRQLFTVRVGLRLTEATQTTMVLGQGARDGGAVCEDIDDRTPGVGYVMIDGTAQPTRVRAFYVTDPDIAALVRTFHAPRPRRRNATGNDSTGTEDQG
ncbi:MAG: FtsK/SpoIIIE domain-containing protein [Actinomycetota bacterium]|uniref:Cell division protein FtsK n=1 Tax=Mycolicibacterium wolinskyi TaxID=59750 RepID=A0A1X2EV12_9MYCO|nr:FtsK/SpoIIIE domain-containing protein [Mycolicibacterium wolinskyi]MCV7285871.1 cell division protein FtsK [Mycolicibacterium wolinskyi]MDY6998657.1 FtsK/SpoIIIE domain-containing protein [Actinomycetota bacterium]ORX10101.1 cell division protein FtsK [Mycolicibacterium wolinskyi]